MSDTDNSPKKNVGISSCISGEFDPFQGQAKEDVNKWSFCYSKSQKKLTLACTISAPPLLIDNSYQSLKSEIDADGINELINWLFQVKNMLQQAKASSTNDNSTS